LRGIVEIRGGDRVIVVVNKVGFQVGKRLVRQE